MRTINLLETLTLHELRPICHDLPKEEREQYEALSGEEYDPDVMAAVMLLIPGPKWCIVAADADEPLAAGGYTQERPGVWRSWMLARPACWTDFAEGVTNVCNGVMEMMFFDFKAHRLETLCMADRSQARRWYERHLGLQCEGIMHGAGKGKEDVAVYAKTRI